MPKAKSATYNANTSQPCQEVGKPQPHPYLLAGNQYFFVGEFIADPVRKMAALLFDQSWITCTMSEFEIGVGPPGWAKRNAHWRECNPIMLPSVSWIRAMKPYGPMENFSLKTRPPFLAAREASVLQSAHVK